MRRLNNVVFTFGRFNPPTIGHEILITRMISEAKLQSADHKVFLSQSYDDKRNPLQWQYRCRIIEAMFPGVTISKDSTIKNPFQALDKLVKTYSNITMVVGEDRLSSFSEGMKRYITEWKINKLDVISAGKRDTSLDGPAGMSSSKVRQYVLENDYNSFELSQSSRLSDTLKRDIFNKIRRELNYKGM